MASKKRIIDSSPGSKSAEKKLKPMANIKETESKSGEMETRAPGMLQTYGIVALNQNILRENIKAIKLLILGNF